MLRSISNEKESVISRGVIQDGRYKFGLIEGACEEPKHHQLRCTDCHLVHISVMHDLDYSMESFKPIV